LANYIATFATVAVSAAQDLFEITAGTNNSIIVKRVVLTTNKTTAEVIPVSCKRLTGASTSGTGGTTPTIYGTSGRYATATAVVEANNTTKSSGGTAQILWHYQWNIMFALDTAPIEEHHYIDVKGGERFVVELVSAPGASVNVSGFIIWEEVG
jgi:hypothetical protein